MKASKLISNIGLGLKKHSPEILAGVGIIGSGVSIFLACKATTKADDILEKHKEQINMIHQVVEEHSEADENGVVIYSDQDRKKDLTMVYTQTVIGFVKLYWPAALAYISSILCICSALNIYKKRNMALTAALTTVANAFSQYRERVKERYGEEVESDIFHNVKEEEIEYTETDKNGKEKTKNKKVKVPDGTASPFCIVFDSSNPNWTGDREVDLCFIKAQQRILTDMLISRKILTLNQAREAFDLDPIEEGQYFGWVYMKDNPNGDNFVDFRLAKDSENFIKFMNKKNDFIFLDLNCDGNIIQYFPSCNGIRKRNN